MQKAPARESRQHMLRLAELETAMAALPLAPADAPQRRVGRAIRAPAVDTEVALAVEQERRRLAEDLHDGLGQWLAIVKIKICSLRNHERRGRVRCSLHDIEALIDRSNQAVRSLMLELSPPVLQTLGLMPAIEWLTEEITRESGLKVVMESQGTPPMIDEPARTTLFRAARELLINVSRHAGCEAAHVRCVANHDALTITVRDGGSGFAYAPPSEARHGEIGFGLVSLIDRIRHIGGEMHVNTAPGCGTSVAILYPLARREQGRA